MIGRPLQRKLRRTLPILAAACLGLNLAPATTPAARALVPYTYLPKSQELEGAGLGIAQAASRLLRLGQAEDAARLASLTVQLLPNDPRSWVLLAEAQLRSNQTKAASASLARAKQLDPRNPGIWFAEGSLALRNSQPQEAIILLRQGLRLDGKNAGAYFDLGNAQILLSRFSEALASFEKAAQLRKDFWESINNQALVLFELGRRPEAIDRWRRVLKIKPTAAEPQLALAAALYQANPGNLESISLADAALSSEPNYVLDSHQKEQLWGVRMREATHQLLLLPQLKATVDRAQANAGNSEEEEE